MRSEVDSAGGYLTPQDPGWVRSLRATAGPPPEGVVSLDTERVNVCCTQASSRSAHLILTLEHSRLPSCLLRAAAETFRA